MHVSCVKCGIEDLLEFSRNFDEVFLEFLSRFDKGLVTERVAESLKDEELVREVIKKNQDEKRIRVKKIIHL